MEPVIHIYHRVDPTDILDDYSWLVPTDILTDLWYLRRHTSFRGPLPGVHGHLAQRKTPTPQGLPKDPTPRPSVGF